MWAAAWLDKWPTWPRPGILAQHQQVNTSSTSPVSRKEKEATRRWEQAEKKKKSFRSVGDSPASSVCRGTSLCGTAKVVGLSAAPVASCIPSSFVKQHSGQTARLNAWLTACFPGWLTDWLPPETWRGVGGLARVGWGWRWGGIRPRPLQRL